MENNGSRIRQFLPYVLIPLLLVATVMLFTGRGAAKKTKMQYYEVVQLFEDDKVAEYSLNLSSGALKYKLRGEDAVKTYTVPNVNMFIEDVHKHVKAHNENASADTMIKFDYEPGSGGSWFMSLLPSLLFVVVLGVAMFVMTRRMSATIASENNRSISFGKARIRNGKDEKRRTTFEDVAGADEEKAELRSIAAPNGEKIYAYMPTFREYQDDDEFIERITPVLSYLDEKLTDGQILYVNLHHYHHRNNYLDVDSFKHIKKFPDKIDTYRLLSITDALISDYSSIFFDFLITGKKVILYVEDLDEYLQHQGLNLDIRKLPLALAFSKEELLTEINSEPVEQNPDGASDEQAPDGATDEQKPDVIDIRDLYKYDRKDNPEKLCGLFEGNEAGLDLHEIPDADVPTVLMYSEGFVSDAETEVIRELALRQSEKPSGENAYDSKPSGGNEADEMPSGENAYEIYVGCDEKITEEHKENAYPWLHDVRVVASLSAQPLSSVGAPLKELYLNKKISFGRAIPYLSHEYALTYQRMYGNAKIDMIAVMDCCEPETLIGTALSPVKHKVLFISKAAANEVRRGNRFLKDALRFSVDYYDLIATLDKDDAKYIRSILPMFKKNRLVTVDGAEETDEIFRTVLSKL